jgi:hypothetical protein
MTIHYLRFASGIALGLTVLALSCSSTTDCDSSGTCASSGGSAAVGGTAAGGGSGGSGGSTSAGSPADGATAGVSGTAEEGGAAGAPAVAPCDGKCSGAMPACDVASQTCVQCIDATQCAAPTPVCAPDSNTCVACDDDPDCSIAAPLCDKPNHACVACLQQSDCTDAVASKCEAGACKPCAIDADCSNIAGKGVCDAGSCVQCTGANFTACGESVGTPLVCDSLARTCTTNKQRSAGLCQTCVADAQCDAGQICVLDTFGSPSKNVGYFCHWKKGDTADGGPALCTSVAPYVGTQTAAVSIDGVVSDICTLRRSTCVARNEFDSKDCTVSNAPSDAACGFSPTNDSKCVNFDVGVNYCTMVCLGNPDCPGTTCDTGASIPVCLLQ